MKTNYLTSSYPIKTDPQDRLIKLTNRSSVSQRVSPVNKLGEVLVHEVVADKWRPV
jgi:hypothetical protein